MRTTDQQHMDELLEALSKLKNTTNNTVCPFTKLIQTLPAEIQNLILSLTKNPAISHRSIHQALRKAGANIARETVSDHRNGRCICTNKEQT
jgi:hypothetical protein